MSNSQSLLSIAMRTAGLAACGVAAGCGGGSGSGSAPATAATVKSVAVSPASNTMMAGQTTQYKSTATYSDGTTADASAATTWSVDASACGSVDASTGVLSGVQGIGTCSVKVKATYTASGGSTLTATAPATVNGLYAAAVTLPNVNVSQPDAVVLADFNGDGNVDVLATDMGGDVDVALGMGNGTFGTPSPVVIGSAATGYVVTADFNGDGKKDAVLSAGAGGLVYLAGASPGPFSAPLTFATQITDAAGLAVGDFNGDGKLDLAAARDTNGSVSVMLGSGNGLFGTATDIALGMNPHFVAVADVNGDGKADLVLADYVAGKIAVLLGNGNGGFGTAIVTTTGGHSSVSDQGNVRVALGDFNGDGHIDVAVTNGTTAVDILAGDGTGKFTSAGSIDVGSKVVSVSAVDVNGDGKLDVVAVGANTGTTSTTANVRITYGDGKGNFGVPIQLAWTVGATTPVGITSYDLIVAGKADLLVPAIAATGSLWLLAQE
ncbi:MAG TPA: VCBS repeat-containing protein [Steroidobacteraceae bacterium]|nr:VCBS repeat-containing protein [Steroidobacteraceae bacterium]